MKDPRIICYSFSNNPFVYNISFSRLDKYCSMYNYKFNPLAKYPAFFHTIGPDIKSQIGGPDGFFFGDLKIKSSSELLFSRDISLTSTG